MKILVTGFAPFLGDPVNPTAKLIERGFSAAGAEITTALLPVSYSRSVLELGSLLQKNFWDWIVLLGQARGRSRICLERVALNWVDSQFPDEDGQTLREMQIAATEPPARFTKVEVGRFARELQREGHPVEVSLSAGAYVCNSLYFHALGKTQTPCVFIHVPLCELNQIAGQPALPLIQMHGSISRFLELLVLTRGDGA